MPTPHDDRSPSLETDERFASGMWRGFYIQWGVRGKQELSLTFFDGQIVGDGADPAGDFRVRGGYDVESGKVWIHKVYPSHTVEYDGHAEPGENKGIWGAWQIRYGFTRDHGGFHIWPDAQRERSTAVRAAEVPLPSRTLAEVFTGGTSEQWGSGSSDWGKTLGE